MIFLLLSKSAAGVIKRGDEKVGEEAGENKSGARNYFLREARKLPPPFFSFSFDISSFLRLRLRLHHHNKMGSGGARGELCRNNHNNCTRRRHNFSSEEEKYGGGIASLQENEV